MSTVFHLVRHADHGHLGKVLTGRAPGVRLSETGRFQAALLARRIAETPIDALLTSPQLRTRETAEFISLTTGCRIEISDSLDEIDFGRWTGQPFEMLTSDPDWVTWNATRDSSCTPAGETMSDVAARLLRLIDGLRETFPSGSVCLVSHADVIKSGVCRYLGKFFQDVHDFEIAPASVTTVAVDSRGSRMISINDSTCREPQEAVH